MPHFNVKCLFETNITHEHVEVEKTLNQKYWKVEMAKLGKTKFE